MSAYVHSTDLKFLMVIINLILYSDWGQVKFLFSKKSTNLPQSQYSEKYSESCQTSKMKCFAKTVNGFYPLTIFAKHAILDVWQSFEHASELITAMNKFLFDVPWFLMCFMYFK